MCGCAEHAKDGGVIPDIGFPWVDVMANEEELAMTIRTRCTHEHSFTGGHLGVIPSKRAFRGSSKTSTEVVVHGS